MAAVIKSGERKILSQRSKKPDDLDILLESRGLYRKRIPRDGNSLFRCIADQVLGSQTYYPEVRKAILNYFWENQSEVEQIMSRAQNPEVPFIDYMINKCLTATRAVYNSSLRVFREPSLEGNCYIEDVSPSSVSGSVPITLSVDSELRWDSIYTHEHMQVMAFCQSEVYKMLYKNVFELKNVDCAVQKMLDKSKKLSLLSMRGVKGQESILKFSCGDYSEFDNEKNLKKLIDRGIPPFPYKVAKSLDPNIYRNVEYDVWDSQKGYRSNEMPECILQVGSKCVVHLTENIKYYGYVQQLMPEQGLVLVFVEQLGEMRELPQHLVEAVRSPCGRLLGSNRYPDGTCRRSRLSKARNVSLTVQTDAVCHVPCANSEEHVALEETVQDYNEDERVQHGSNTSIQSGDYSLDISSNTASGGDSDGDENQDDCNKQEEVDNNFYIDAGACSGFYPYYIHPVNIAVNPSLALDGSDLPHNDIATLRYFFNQGVQYMRSVHLSVGGIAPSFEEIMGSMVVQMPATAVPLPAPGTPTEAVICPTHIYNGDTIPMQPYIQEGVALSLPPNGSTALEGTSWVAQPTEFQPYPPIFIAAAPGSTAPMLQHWPSGYPYTP